MTYQKLTNAMLSLTDGDRIAIPKTRNSTLEGPILMEGKTRFLYPLGGAGREPSKLRTSRPPCQIPDFAAGKAASQTVAVSDHTDERFSRVMGE